MQKLISILARIPSESAKFDWIGFALAAGVVAAVMLLGIPLDQAVGLLDALMAFAAVALGRAVSLGARRKAAAADALALAQAVAAMRRGEPLPADTADRVGALVDALAPSPADTVREPVLSIVRGEGAE